MTYPTQELIPCAQCGDKFWATPERDNFTLELDLVELECEQCRHGEQLQDFEDQIAAGDDHDGRMEAHCG